MPTYTRLLLSFAFVFVSLTTSLAQAAATQSTGASKANSDSVYQQIRQKSNSAEDFTGQVATVNGLVLRRDAAIFKFNSGEIYFLSPVEGRVIGAVFLGDVEMTLVPPTQVERRSLSIFTGPAGLADHFTRLVMRFTDQTFQEIKQSPGVQMNAGGAQVARARDAYREIQTLLRKQAHYNLDLRTLGDIYAPQRPGFFMAFPGGGRFDKLAYVIDPLGITEVAPEQVALFSFGEARAEIWAAFHLSGEYQKGRATSGQDRRLYDITHHEIEGTIRGTRIIASDRITMRALAPGTRVLPFDLYRTLRVSRVLDEQGRELGFIVKTGRIARFLIYPKGAYILHMIRMLMYDHRGGGDALFRAMMSDFVQTHFNKNVSTEDFKLVVEKHMTPQMDLDKNRRMDWFFNAWVYGTDIPAYRLDYQIGSADGKAALTIKVTQSGVSENFRMMVPFYADFGKGWTRLGAVKLTGNSSVDIPNIPLPQSPKRVTLCALADVLYTSLDTNKK